MRCKKHLTDLSSRVGVCSSCLRERLFALVAAQARAQVQEDRRKSDPQNSPPLAFPRSVSPYVAGNMSHHSDHHLHRSPKDQLFFSTPQIGPNCGVFTGDLSAKQQKKSKFSVFSRLFKFKSRNPDSDRDLDPRVSNSTSRSSCTAASSSPSWFSSMLSVRRKNKSRLHSLNEPTARFARGMSPARVSDYGGEAEWCESSGYSSESSQSWWHKPGRAATPSRRGVRRSQTMNLSGMKFCLSPLVRASPNRHWNQKGVLPEAVFPGDIRVPARTHVSPAASLCASRSRKLADFGRFKPFNHNH